MNPVIDQKIKPLILQKNQEENEDNENDETEVNESEANEKEKIKKVSESKSNKIFEWKICRHSKTRRL